MTVDRRRFSASDKELQSLTDHFNDVGFRDYPRLVEDCKRHVIQCLDGRTVVRIGACSRTEQRLAADVPWKIHKISFHHHRHDIVYVMFDLTGKIFGKTFHKHAGTNVFTTSNENLLMEHTNNVYYKESVAFFEFLLKKCKYGVEKINLNISEETLDWASRDDSPIEYLPNLREVDFCITENTNSTVQKVWLKKIPEQLKSLTIERNVTPEVVEWPHVRLCSFYLHLGSCNVSDAQLLELNAAHIKIERATHITARGLNVFLKRWQREGGVDGFQSMIIVNVGPGGDRVRPEDVLDGLDSERVCYYHMIESQLRPGEMIRVDFRQQTNFMARLWD